MSFTTPLVILREFLAPFVADHLQLRNESVYFAVQFFFRHAVQGNVLEAGCIIAGRCVNVNASDRWKRNFTCTIFGKFEFEIVVAQQVPPLLHKLSSFESRDISGGQRKPFAVTALVGEATMPIGFDSSHVVSADKVNNLSAFR
jgi:hypothetical protein